MDGPLKVLLQSKPYFYFLFFSFLKVTYSKSKLTLITLFSKAGFDYCRLPSSKGKHDIGDSFALISVIRREKYPC